MRIRAGTSGFSYKEWKGPFYPEDLPNDAMLAFYAGKFTTVEINNSFYRMPSPDVLSKWASQAGDDFRFVLKAPRRISHEKRLRGAEAEVSRFLTVQQSLGSKVGPILVQLPPFQKKDVERLREFLPLLRGARPALEFRHESWFDEEVRGVLSSFGAALVVADNDEGGAGPLWPTASFGYLRLRRTNYDEATLRDWFQRVSSQPWEEAFIFFKHEDAGNAASLAGRFQALGASAG